MSQPVFLSNPRGPTFQATEYHDVVCRRRNKCKCVQSVMHSIGGKRFTQKSARGFHVFPGKASEVDFEVLHLPEVKKALKKGWLKKIEASVAQPLLMKPKKVEAAVQAPSAPSQPKPAVASDSGKKGRG